MRLKGPEGNMRGEWSMEMLPLETPNPVAGSFSSRANRPLNRLSSRAIIEPTIPAPMTITSKTLSAGMAPGEGAFLAASGND